MLLPAILYVAFTLLATLGLFLLLRHHYGLRPALTWSLLLLAAFLALAWWLATLIQASGLT